MKKGLIIVFNFLLSISLFGYDFKVGNYYYSIIDPVNHKAAFTYETSAGNSYSGDVVIPSSVGRKTLVDGRIVIVNYSVVAIADSAFMNCSGLTSVSIPTSVTSIGYRAFRWCSGLSSVAIPSVVNYIGGQAFSLCTSLDSIQIPKLIDTIKSNTFSGCYSLRSVSLPGSVTTIEDYAFSGCRGLRSVDLSGNLKTIGSYAFTSCEGLTSLTIPKLITAIGSNAFSGCTGLTSIDIRNTVLGYGQFRACTSLSSITLPPWLTNLNIYAFDGCTGLTEVHSNHNTPLVWTSMSHVFEGVNLANCQLFVPPGSSGVYAVSYGWQDFGQIEEERICFKHENLCYRIIDAGNRKVEVTYTQPAGNSYSGAIIISSQIWLGPDEYVNESVGDSAFMACTGLTSVTIPSSVKQIGYRAFKGCSGLSTVSIPSSVTRISESAFYSCTGMTTLSIPASIDTISSYAFGNCVSLKSVILPSSVKVIESFSFMGCLSMSNIFIPSSVFSIGSYTFYKCSKLNNVIIPASVSSIGDNVFTDCTGLNSVYIKNRRIGMYEFKGCSGLISYSIPTCVESVGNGAFQNCTGLTSLTIPSSVASIGDLAFSGCSGLESIHAQNDYPHYFPTTSKVFDQIDKNTCILYVPKGTAVHYKNADKWSEFSTIIEEWLPVSLNLSLNNKVLGVADVRCFNAFEEIVLAGSGSIVVLDVGSVSAFIAGETIRFLPGFSALEGCSMKAWITSDEMFCKDVFPAESIQHESKSLVMSFVQQGFKNSDEQSEVKLYPNPNRGRFSVELPEFGKAAVYIYTSSGQHVYSASLEESDKFDLDLGPLSNGLYFLKINFQNKLIMEKFIVN